MVGEIWALKVINNILMINGFSLNDFSLPNLNTFMNNEFMQNFSNYQLNVDDNGINSNNEKKVEKLNISQKEIFDIIIDAVYNKKENKCFYIDGQGGTRNSYLLNSFIEFFNENGISVITVAWTGIAANLLINGKTVHNIFKLPLTISEQTTCNIKPNSNSGNIIKSVQVIIWDEITMTSKHGFEAVDRLIRDLTGINETFGNKVIITSGDLRQTLPIIRHGSKASIIQNCIKSSTLWSNFKYLSLTINMRVCDSTINEFKNWLMKVGNGKFTNKFEIENEAIRLPNEILTKNDIITEIYGNTMKIYMKRSF